MVNFNGITKPEMDLIHKIALRAINIARDAGISYALIDAEMDLCAVHNNTTPLKLKELLEADDGNFGHDVFGIRKYLNRENGKLENFFLPRFSV